MGSLNLTYNLASRHRHWRDDRQKISKYTVVTLNIYVILSHPDNIHFHNNAVFDIERGNTRICPC